VTKILTNGYVGVFHLHNDNIGEAVPRFRSVCGGGGRRRREEEEKDGGRGEGRREEGGEERVH